MNAFSLKFKLKPLELEYEHSKLQSNIYGFHVIFTFNMILNLIICIISLISNSLIEFSFSLFFLFMIIITFPIMKIPRLKVLLSDFILMYLILFPFFAGVYFFLQNIKSGYDGFVGGFVFNMYLSFPIRIKMNWYKKFMIHVPAYTYIEVSYYKHCKEISFGFIAILAIMTLNLLFDFYQDKVERKNFLIEHYFKKNNKVFQHLFTNVIPEEILIWKKSGIDFANKSALELFKVNNKEELEPILLRNVEIDENDTPDIAFHSEENHVSEKIFIKNDYYKSRFLKKINEILNNDAFERNEVNFLAKITIPEHNSLEKSKEFKKDSDLYEGIKNLSKKKEFEIKMRRFFWGDQESVLILFNAVEERNLKSRFEFVNYYLNYLLANLSHEIYTPLNGLLGMLEVSITNLKNSPVIKENLIIARNSADFLLTITQDLFDFYNIRRGKLAVNVSKISLSVYMKELFMTFSNCFEKNNILMESYLETEEIHSDPQKLKQIMIGIINHIINNLINAKVSVFIRQSLDIKYVVIEIKATGLAMNPLKIGDNILGTPPPPLKISRHLSYDRKLSLNEGQIFAEIGNFGCGNLELHLIHYLSLCLAPEIDVPFQKRMVQTHDKDCMEYFFQIYLSNITENKVRLIEDVLHDKISFHAEYRVMEYREFLDNSQKESGVCINLEEKFMKTPLLNCNREEKIMKNPSGLTIFEVNSEIFEEKKIEDVSLKANMDNYHTRNNFSSMFSIPKDPLEQVFDFSRSHLKKNMKKEALQVLNVDDNPINLMVISNYCKMSGIRVIEAINGKDALEKTQKFYLDEDKCFDLVFMDCDMPVLDGFLACEKVLKFCERNEMKIPPIIAITANDTYEDRMKAKKCGMKELVKKPLSKNKFDELIGFWVRKLEI